MRARTIALLIPLLVLVGCGRPPRGKGQAPLPPAPAVQGPVVPAPIPGGTTDIPDLVARVKPGVVNITTTKEVRVSGGVGFPFGFFRGGLQPFGDRVLKSTSLGTGFVIDSAGHVVTNAHVVKGADEVKVRLADEREFTANVKGRDTKLDVAVLELEGASNLPSESLGSSEELRVGESVVAIGNPFGLGFTVTMGIVSAKSRTINAGPYDDFIQTDASINPGNSGGPLFNLRGQVIGINTAINQAAQGIGFAIPIDDVRQIIPQLLRTGHVERGLLGIWPQRVDAAMAKALGLDHPHGALVSEVQPGGPAEKAGIKPGDVIVSVDKTTITTHSDLPRVVASHEPGTTVDVRFLRDKAERSVRVTLDALRDEAQNERSEPMNGPSARTRGIGIAIADTPDGVVVSQVAPDSVADGSLSPGDVIVEVNRVPVARAHDVAVQVEKVPIGQPVMMKIVHGGRPRFVAIERR